MKNGFGDQLREWRKLRKKSQLELALDAEISSKHISFLETGRANPTKEMIHRLSDVLDIPFRERNLLMLGAGLSPSGTSVLPFISWIGYDWTESYGIDFSP
ncbi:helix-turn-helix domain-containing protein [Leptospira sp. WS39.C2]